MIPISKEFVGACERKGLSERETFRLWLEETGGWHYLTPVVKEHYKDIDMKKVRKKIKQSSPNSTKQVNTEEMKENE